MARVRTPQEAPPPTFTAPGLRLAAEVLDEKALGGGDISISNGVELRALAKHLRGLADSATVQEASQ